MLFLINFKKIIGRAPRSSKQPRRRKQPTINNASLLTVLRTARATEEAATFQANNKTIENANENNLKLKFNSVHP